MTIAIPTYAPGAITSYSELLAEVRDMMDDVDYPQVAFEREGLEIVAVAGDGAVAGG